MSLFSDLSKKELIENPRNINNYKRILKEKKEKEENKTWKQICAEKKLELQGKEYTKWLNAQYYKRNKENIKKKYDEQVAEKEAYIEEIYKEVYDTIPDPINRDKFYMEKFRDDDVKSNGYRFAWWSSKLARIRRRELPKQKLPFKVVKVRGMDRGMTDMRNIQNEAYKYLKPHMSEFGDVPLSIQRKQHPYDYPVYSTTDDFEQFVKAGPVNPGHTYLVFDAMRRGKYIASETYLGRNSFIFGDVVVTQTGKLFRIALENNLPWLTKDTVEDIHRLRISWRREKGEVRPPIYIVNDAYLIKIKLNDRDVLYYISPT